MPLPRAVPVTLAAAERTMLKKRLRGAKTAYRDRLRAQIVLAAARGRDNVRIAADLQVTSDTVRKWRGRFAARGLAGLSDLPRCGRPRRGSEVNRAAVDEVVIVDNRSERRGQGPAAGRRRCRPGGFGWPGAHHRPPGSEDTSPVISIACGT